MGKQLLYLSVVAPVFEGEAWNALKTVNVGKILSDLYREGNPRCFLDGILYQDLFINYAWSVAIASDISGMSNSLEIRSPFLDHKVVEFAFSLPTGMKLKRFNSEKYILYKAGSAFLPQLVIKRKKMPYGTGIPYKKWFFNEWMPFVRSIILDYKIAGYHIFDLSYIEKLLTKSDCDAVTFKLLWQVLCVCAWMHNL